MKCDGCLNSMRIISENGFHSICCLSEKKAIDCFTDKEDHSVFLPGTANYEESEAMSNDARTTSASK